ncbi:MAG: aldo/keto reductase [Clostridia bacterium]|nr:aldo/keto reductase [Clostridia bacterium]
MRQNRLGRTGLKVSAIAYGGIVSTMSDFANYTYSGDGQQASDDYVATALEAGVNYFDVAPRYGDAQEKLGNSLRGIRKNITLACKTRWRDYESAARDAERSLKLLHTDHFDIYQLHALGSIEEVERAFAPDGVMRLMEELKKSGTARFLGITAHSEGAALKALELFDFDTVLFPTNWQMNMAIGYGDQIIRKARERNMGVLGMKSMIERGFGPDDDELRSRWPKSWCKPFDPDTQSEMLLAAMKYARTMGPDTLIPAGDIEHFRFAVEHADEIWNASLTQREKELLESHLPVVRDLLFMPEQNR